MWWSPGFHYHVWRTWQRVSLPQHWLTGVWCFMHIGANTAGYSKHDTTHSILRTVHCYRWDCDKTRWRRSRSTMMLWYFMFAPTFVIVNSLVYLCIPQCVLVENPEDTNRWSPLLLWSCWSPCWRARFCLLAVSGPVSVFEAVHLATIPTLLIIT